MTARVIIVGCGFPQLGLVRRAKALGLSVIGVDMNPRAIAVRDCADFAEISTIDEDAIAAFVAKSGVRALTTTGSERALTTTVAVAARLGLPFYADLKAVRRAQEKDAMRAAYRDAGLSIPRYIATSSASDARRFAEDVGLPVVVKPTHGWGQRGVARVEAMADFDAFFADALATSRTAGGPGAEAVVEALIHGREYSVNGWIEDGALVSYCVTERITVPGNKPLGVMLSEVYPSGLEPADEARVIDEARRGAAAVGLRRGPCYSQVAWDERERRAHLFETAARCGGGFDADVTLLASGVDLYTRILGVATERPDWERSGADAPTYRAALVKFVIGKPGRITRIDGLDRARALPGIDAAEIFAGVGEQVHPLTDAAKRAGYVLAHGGTRGEAEARADAALAAIDLVTAPEDDA